MIVHNVGNEHANSLAATALLLLRWLHGLSLDGHDCAPKQAATQLKRPSNPTRARKCVRAARPVNAPTHSWP